jgi:hypothetical protein
MTLLVSSFPSMTTTWTAPLLSIFSAPYHLFSNKRNFAESAMRADSIFFFHGMQLTQHGA